ncbi:ubiquitin-like domain-containing protein [Fictibacillus iocasae]|uniref:Ubiquitin-like domain-containing protein n=1 Tax=Fictibacillus iocasae TaxID=2715437 RepID=A0ABW2NMW2_9BACL
MQKNFTSLFSELIRKKLVVSAVLILALAVTTGFVSYETSKTDINLLIAGKEATVSSHADTVGELLKENDIEFNKHDEVKPGVHTELEQGMKVEYIPAKKISLSVNGNKTKAWTTAETVGEFVKENKLDIKEHDEIKPGLSAKLEDEDKVTLKSAVPVKLASGAKPKQVWTTSTTVADLLKQQNVTLGKLDRVQPAAGTKLKSNMQVNIIRVEKVTDVVEEETPFATVKRNDDSLAKGTEKVVSVGTKGKVSKSYEVIKENGKEVSRKLLSTKETAKSKDRVVAVGTKVSAPAKRAVVSRSSSKPPSSGRVLTVSSTAYTANCEGCSGITATGFNLKKNPNAKVIAVDPSVIPLGSKVYVEGYGYAIASDTGGAIKGNKIDVFFASQSQAVAWGRKTITIRIID